MPGLAMMQGKIMEPHIQDKWLGSALCAHQMRARSQRVVQCEFWDTARHIHGAPFGGPPTQRGYMPKGAQGAQDVAHDASAEKVRGFANAIPTFICARSKSSK